MISRNTITPNQSHHHPQIDFAALESPTSSASPNAILQGMTDCIFSCLGIPSSSPPPPNTHPIPNSHTFSNHSLLIDLLARRFRHFRSTFSPQPYLHWMTAMYQCCSKVFSLSHHHNASHSTKSSSFHHTLANGQSVMRQFMRLLDELLGCLDWSMLCSDSSFLSSSSSYWNDLLGVLVDLGSAQPILIHSILKALVKFFLVSMDGDYMEQHAPFPLPFQQSHSTTENPLKLPTSQKHSMMSLLSSCIHNSIMKLLSLVPTSCMSLLACLREVQPHPRSDLSELSSFWHHSLLIASQVLSIRASLLEMLIDTLIEIDLAIQGNIDEFFSSQSTDSDSETEEQANHDADDNDDADDADDGSDQLEQLIKSADNQINNSSNPSMDAVMQDERKAALLSNVCKFDRLMEMLLSFLEYQSISTQTAVSTRKKGTAESKDLQRQGQEDRLSLFECLMGIFERRVLTTFNSRFIQYFMFYFCSLDSTALRQAETVGHAECIAEGIRQSNDILHADGIGHVRNASMNTSDYFLATLLRIVLIQPNSSQSTPNDSLVNSHDNSTGNSRVNSQGNYDAIRVIAAAYLSGFLARAAYLQEGLILRCYDMMLTWCEQYIQGLQDKQPTVHPTTTTTSFHGNVNKNNNSPLSSVGLASSTAYTALSPAKHIVFYSVCQALFYVYCFRYGLLMRASHGTLDSQASTIRHHSTNSSNTSIVRHSSTEHQSSNSFSAPTPLSAPSSTSSDMRFRVTRGLSLLVHSRLNPLRIVIPSIANEFVRLAAQTECLFLNGLMEQNKRLPVEPYDGELLAFFPFDPCHLPRCGVIIRRGTTQTTVGDDSCKDGSVACYMEWKDVEEWNWKTANGMNTLIFTDDMLLGQTDSSMEDINGMGQVFPTPLATPKPFSFNSNNDETDAMEGVTCSSIQSPMDGMLSKTLTALGNIESFVDY